MSQVAVAAAGTGAEDNNVGVLNVPYPASVAASDLLVLVLQGGAHGAGFGTPSGWSRPSGFPADVDFGTVGTIGGTCAAVFYKWAAGGETGNLACTRTLTSTGDHFIGRMYRLNGFTATGGDPFTGEATSTGTDATMESPAVGPAVGANDMGLLLAFLGDDNATGNWDEAAESVEWVETVAELASVSGNDGLLAINHCASVGAGASIPANLETMGAADPWYIWAAIVKESAGGGTTPVSVTLDLPVEGQASVSVTPTLPLEALLSVLATGTLPADAAAAVSAASLLPAEAAGTVGMAVQLPAEALATVAAQLGLPLESDGAVVISQILTIPLEATASVQTSAQAAVDALAAVAAAAALPAETVAQLAGVHNLPAEMLASAIAAAVLPLEGLGRVASVTLLPLESRLAAIPPGTVVLGVVKLGDRPVAIVALTDQAVAVAELGDRPAAVVKLRDEPAEGR